MARIFGAIWVLRSAIVTAIEAILVVQLNFEKLMWNPNSAASSRMRHRPGITSSTVDSSLYFTYIFRYNKSRTATIIFLNRILKSPSLIIINVIVRI